MIAETTCVKKNMTSEKCHAYHKGNCMNSFACNAESFLDVKTRIHDNSDKKNTIDFMKTMLEKFKTEELEYSDGVNRYPIETVFDLLEVMFFSNGSLLDSISVKKK